jgi:hypothetical protein
LYVLIADQQQWFHAKGYPFPKRVDTADAAIVVKSAVTASADGDRRSPPTGRLARGMSLPSKAVDRELSERPDRGEEEWRGGLHGHLPDRDDVREERDLDPEHSVQKEIGMRKLRS